MIRRKVRRFALYRWYYAKSVRAERVWHSLMVRLSEPAE